jgi:hypothetical protein
MKLQIGTDLSAAHVYLAPGENDGNYGNASFVLLVLNPAATVTQAQAACTKFSSYFGTLGAGGTLVKVHEGHSGITS